MFPVFLLVLGFSGIAAQVVLLRLVLTTAQGNELAIGVMVGLWVVSESLGAFAIRKSLKENARSFLFAFNSIFSILFPISLLFPLLSRQIFGLTFGEVLVVQNLVFLSLLSLFPLGFLHGGLFVIATRVFSLLKANSIAQPIGKTYIFENGGTIIGGLLLYFLLIPFLTPHQIAFLLGAINFSVLFLMATGKKALFLFRREGIISLLFLLIFGFLFLYEPKIRRPILSLWWGKENIVHSGNTVYGNITITEKEGEYTLFYDGFPIFTVPNPNVAFNEDLAHFSLLAHPAPKSCLLIGQGLGGLIKEILKHPIEKLDYLELDPEIPRRYKKLSLGLTEEELRDRRVNLFYRDSRSFLQEGETKYDIIIINHLLPLTLNFNRYFTKEFYSECLGRLNPSGSLVTISPYSLSYQSEELKDLILTHYSTLKEVFPEVTPIVGDFNIYIASLKGGLSLDTFAARFRERRVAARMFSQKYLKVRLSPFYLEAFERIVSPPSDKVVNSDLKPKGLLRSLAYLTGVTSPKLPRIYKGIENIRFETYLISLLLILVVIFLAARFGRGRERRKIFIPFILLSTGFWGMVQNIILIFIFQIRFGYLFSRITLLLTVFILGATLGSFFALLLLKRRGDYSFGLLLINESLILLSSFLVLLLAHFRVGGIEGEVTLFSLSLLTGLFLGFQFPLANFLYYVRCASAQGSGKEEKIAETVGLLFAADLFGGTLGAFLSSLLIIPSLGIILALTLIIALKFLSLLFAVSLRLQNIDA